MNVYKITYTTHTSRGAHYAIIETPSTDYIVAESYEDAFGLLRDAMKNPKILIRSAQNICPDVKIQPTHWTRRAPVETYPGPTDPSRHGDRHQPSDLPKEP